MMSLLNPDSQTWPKTFFICSVIAVTLDPMFLYIPIINGTDKCLDTDLRLAIIVCVLRSFCDILYVFNIIIKFRAAWPSVRSYLTSDFIIDGLAALPLPQFAVLLIIPKLDGQPTISKENTMKFIIFCLYVPRVIQASLLYKKMANLFHFRIEEPLFRAAYNLLFYVLASHVIGAVWYFFAIESELRCWHTACKRHNSCDSKYLYCGNDRDGDYSSFLDTSCPLLERTEIKNSTNFDFGIYIDALRSQVLESTDVGKKLLYCSLWGLQNLSSLGQSLKASTFAGEIFFAYFIAIIGLVLFALLIGNMQKYLQSPSNLTHRKEEEIREIRNETEDIMSHFSLPQDLKCKVRRHKRNKWELTHGVDVDSFVRDFPPDLKIAIKRHIFLPSLEKVPIFKSMDEQLLDAMCDRLKQVVYPEDSCLVREGDPEREILFITQGDVESVTTNGGKTCLTSKLNVGDLCGEELFAWALKPQKSPHLPFSTRTVKTLSENVQAFALVAEDVLFLASNFKSFQTRDVQDTFRNYRRTWAACYIQYAWREHCKKKQKDILEDKIKRLQESLATCSETSTLSHSASVYVSRFTSNALRNLRQKPTQPTMQQSLPLGDDGPQLQIKTE